MNVTAYGIPETLRLTSNTRYQGKSLKDISGLISPLPCKVSFEKRWDRSRADGTLTCCIYHLQTFSSHRESCESFAIWLTQKRNLRFRLVSADLGLVRWDSCSRVRSHSHATGAAFYSIAFTPLDCFCVTGRPLRRTSVKETACEAIITQLRPDKARHSTPQPCQSVRLDTGRRAERPQDCVCLWQERKKKKVLLWGNIYLSLPLSISSLSSFLSPESVQSKHL